MPVYDHAFVAVERKTGGGILADQDLALPDSPKEAVKNLEGRTDVAFLKHVAELIAVVGGELIDVGLLEYHVIVIEGLKKVAQNLLGSLGIQGVVVIVALLHNARHHLPDNRRCGALLKDLDGGRAQAPIQDRCDD